MLADVKGAWAVDNKDYVEGPDHVPGKVLHDLAVLRSQAAAWPEHHVDPRSKPIEELSLLESMQWVFPSSTTADRPCLHTILTGSNWPWTLE